MEHNILVEGESLSGEKFAVPSKEFGIMPFWFWNGEMSYEEISYQLKEFKDKGCPAIYIHARFGVREELGYMNEAWLDRCRYTIEKAKELGLQTWIYDEYNWPSGTCGQTIMKDRPELTNVYLELVESDLPGQYFMFMEGTDSRYNDMEQSEPIYACAIKHEDMASGNYQVVDLMPSLSFDKVITWEAPKGPWKLFYFIERQSSWYSDVLNPETTKVFLEYTHDKYKKYLGKENFGEVKGFFTDEPAMHYFETGRDNFCIPWTRQMFKIFRERNGYDLRQNLPKLFFDCGGDTEQVRYDFWSTLSEQYNKAYFAQIHDWCKENDVVFTGHLLYEESMRLHGRVDGNLFQHLAQFDMTGIDHLYPRIGTREMENEHVALKIASSAAHQNGSVRLCCESMGGSYWDCTMERMKWIADWEYVLGVNQFIPHGLHYSVEGERKRDWPPSMFYQFTWWEQYGQFNDYVTRMGYTLSGGDHVAKVAMLYPLNSIWANYTPNKRNKIGDVIENDFATLTDRLLRLHVDFDYLDEDVLCDRCTIENGELRIQGEQYEMLLLPPVTHIKAKTLEKIEAFVAAGGKVLADALLPYKVIEGRAEDVKERVEALFGVEPTALRDRFLAGTDTAQSITVRNVGKGKVVFVAGSGFKANKDESAMMAVLDKAVRECITPEIEISSDEVFYLHRVKDGRDLFFLVNPVDFAADITVTWTGTHGIELWNLETGEITPVPVLVHKDGKTTIQAHLEPYGSVMYGFTLENPAAHICYSDIQVEGAELDAAGHGTIAGCGRLEKPGKVVVSAPEGEKTLDVPVGDCLPVIPLEGAFDFSVDKPNSLNTDNWKMTYSTPGEDVEAITSGKADMSGWYPMHMGAWELQLPMERDELRYPVDLWYVTQVEAAFVPQNLHLMIDGFKGAGYTLFINGREVTETPVRSYLDAEMKEVPIASYFVEGTNTVAVKLTVTKKSDGMTDLLKIIGAFAVENRNGVEVIVPPVTQITLGDWCAKKLPYYSGTGYYTTTVNLDARQIGKRLMLQCELGKDVLTVQVNGQMVKTCLWKPYEADISAYVHEGENTITLGVVNTLMNLLESSHTPSGLTRAEIVPYDRYELHA